MTVKISSIPFHKASIGDEEINEVVDTLKSGWLTMGPKTINFEKQFAKAIGVDFAVSMNSATACLHLALKAVGLNAGDEVIIPTTTFASTAEVVTYFNATPVLCDIRGDDHNIDVSKIEALITEKTKVIIPVHFSGIPCDMDAIMEIAEQYGLFVLEDVAQAFGAEWMGKKLGSCGTIGAFSFYPTKNLGGFGDGGLVATHDDRLAELVRMLLGHGGKDKYNVEHIGYNSRLDVIQASVLQVKLRYVDEFNLKRRTIAEIYNRGLQDLTHIKLPLSFDSYQHIYHQYTIRVAGGAELNCG